MMMYVRQKQQAGRCGFALLIATATGRFRTYNVWAKKLFWQDQWSHGFLVHTPLLRTEDLNTICLAMFPTNVTRGKCVS
jgi:hypothetical protein